MHFIRTGKFQKWIECSFYSIITILIMAFGNAILASRIIDWPDKYHPVSLISQEMVVEDIKMIHGKWIISSGKIKSDCFLTDIISFSEDNMFFN